MLVHSTAETLNMEGVPKRRFWENPLESPTHGQGEVLSRRRGDVPAHFSGLPEDRPLADHTVSGGIKWEEGFKAVEEAGQKEKQQH